MQKESMPSIYEKQTNVCPIQKTLRFALKPIGETAKKIKEKNLLSEDEKRAEKYKQAKKIIDEYHKHHIDTRLSKFKFCQTDLETFEARYRNLKKDKNDKDSIKQFEEIQTTLRKAVSKQLYDKSLFDKKLIMDILPKWLDDNQLELEGIGDPKRIIDNFKGWTAYFGGFHENRKNIYTDKPHSTAIAYRLIHENLPRFIDNMDRYKKAKTLGADFSEVEKNGSIKDLDAFFTLKNFNQCLTQKGIDTYNLVRGGRSVKEKTKKEQGINEIINLSSQKFDSKKSDASDEDKKELSAKEKQLRACKLEELYKQILSDREYFSFQLEGIPSDAYLCQYLKAFYLDNDKNLILKKEHIDETTGEITERDVNITKGIKSSLANLENADGSKVYIKNDTAITTISQNIFGNWSIIKNGLEALAKALFPQATKKNEDKRASWLKTAYFSFEEIHKGLRLFFETFDEELDKDSADSEGITQTMRDKALNNPLIHYFKKLDAGLSDDYQTLFDEIIQKNNAFKQVVEKICQR